MYLLNAVDNDGGGGGDDDDGGGNVYGDDVKCSCENLDDKSNGLDLSGSSTALWNCLTKLRSKTVFFNAIRQFASTEMLQTCITLQIMSELS